MHASNIETTLILAKDLHGQFLQLIAEGTPCGRYVLKVNAPNDTLESDLLEAIELIEQWCSAEGYPTVVVKTVVTRSSLYLQLDFDTV